MGSTAARDRHGHPVVVADADQAASAAIARDLDGLAPASSAFSTTLDTSQAVDHSRGDGLRWLRRAWDGFGDCWVERQFTRTARPRHWVVFARDFVSAGVAWMLPRVFSVLVAAAGDRVAFCASARIRVFTCHQEARCRRSGGRGIASDAHLVSTRKVEQLVFVGLGEVIEDFTLARSGSDGGT